MVMPNIQGGDTSANDKTTSTKSQSISKGGTVFGAVNFGDDSAISTEAKQTQSATASTAKDAVTTQKSYYFLIGVVALVSVIYILKKA